MPRAKGFPSFLDTLLIGHTPTRWAGLTRTLLTLDFAGMNTNHLGNMHPKKTRLTWAMSVAAATTISIGMLVWQSQAADAKDSAIKQVMKAYHKAPKGVDPVCKKASDGKATPDELKKLVAAYKLLPSAKPPKGDEGSWKEKTSKLVAATESLQKGDADGIAKYKEAVNCKACHSVHRAD